jgi:hypothetical protein
MRRMLAVAAVLSLVLAAAGDADAGRKKRKKKGKKAAPTMTVEQQKALAGFMGAFKFGMSHKDVIKVVSKQIRERYAEKIAATNDVYTQDKLRRKRDRQIKRFKKSLTKFEGKKTGWDVSIIDDQFRHNTGESMMVHWETHEGRDQRRFFFFFRGKLYKMFIALNTGAIAGAEGKGFDYFRSLMESRFGPGQDVNGKVEWRSKKLLANAINKLGLYGTFCLVIADRDVEADLRKVRVANAKAEKKNNIIEAIKDDGSEPDIGANSNTIDSIIKE